MRLEIENFARIRQADIIVDGITVIAGENDTGKSTIGKSLFSLFNSVSDIEGKIINQRVREIYSNCRLIIRTHAMQYAELGQGNDFSISRRLSAEIRRMLEQNETVDTIVLRKAVENLLRRVMDEGSQMSVPEIVDEICDMAEEIIDLPQETIMLEVLSRYFDSVFSGQINSLRDPATLARLMLEIKGKKIELQFVEDACIDYVSEINIINKAIYIDNPFQLDRLDSAHGLSVLEQSLRELLTYHSDTDMMDGVIGSVLAKERRSVVYSKLADVIQGRITEKRQNKYYLEQEELRDPISIDSLSAGMKAFVILKMLLEKGQIDKRDVVIFDEPEIHLHPQWQIVYAELIVLLQKYFDLSVVITTHSPYFVDAVNLYSVKHGIEGKVNYYLASVKDGWAGMENVTENIDKIYQMMASPIQLLDTLRYELNNN